MRGVACGADPFGCRIVTALRAYGQTGPAEVWLQTRGGRISAALCRVDGEVTLCAGHAADKELLGFLSFLGCRSILLPRGILPAGWGTIAESGWVMRWRGEPGLGAANTTAPTVRSLFSLLTAAGLVSPDDGVYADLSHKLRHGLVRASGRVDAKGELLSCAMTVAESHGAAVIGGVATLPGQRGKGFAGELVRGMASALTAEGKQVFLFCRGDLVSFYRRLGFRAEREWENRTGDCGGADAGVQ